MDVGGATLAAAAMRAGLIERVRDRHPPGPGGRRQPFFTSLDNWVNLNLVETRTFPDGVLLTSVRDQALNTRPRIGAASGHPRISWPLGSAYGTRACVARTWASQVMSARCSL